MSIFEEGEQELINRAEHVKEFMRWRYYVYTGPNIDCTCLYCQYEVVDAWYEENLEHLLMGDRA